MAALLAATPYSRQITHHRVLEARQPEYAACRRPWPKAIEALLEAAHIRLYTHQAQALDLIRAGRDVVVTTPTASGKSLIYNLPVLERFLADREARALYLFPLKALAQDQRRAMTELCAAWPSHARPEIALYDGDTSDHFRRKIRKNPPTVLITNPEMLHLALLPFHEQWTTFLASLAYVVVDEAHMYRGVFGSHVAQLLRRLNRVCERYNARPVRILCTATVGNPEELGHNLLALPPEQPLASVERSGAPQGSKHMVFMDPENSPATLAIQLLRAALARNLRTIVYCRSRRMTELISVWASQKSGASSRISAYRAGFLPEERREIENKLSSGELLAVISTSALELGIDIGTLDVCILVGYPGTVVSTLQRGGRVGRAGQESAILLIAGEDALDQFFIHHPEEFFSRSPERAVLNPDNAVILERHVECAAAELPLRKGDSYINPAVAQALQSLEQQGLVLRTAEGDRFVAARKRPQRHVDLRGAGASFSIQDEHNTLIGTLDAHQAFREAHEGAVYLHRGTSYVISKLDRGAKIAYAQAENVPWHTKVRTTKSTEILSTEATRMAAGLPVGFGKLRVTELITGYERRLNGSLKLLDIQPLDVPPLVFDTEGLWMVIPDAAREAVEEALLHFMGSIHAMEHVAIGLMPLLVMADRNDFGGISIPLHGQLNAPAVFVYDGLPGGAGLTRSAFALLEDLLHSMHQCLLTCPCESGCPSCTHSPKCGSGNRPIDKAGASFLLEQLLHPTVQVGATAQQASVGKSQEDTPMQNKVSEPVAEKDIVVKDIVVLDVETRRSAAEVGGWHLASRMGVSVAVLYADGDFHAYEQEQLPALFERLRRASLVVGFNIERFDYAVLQPFANYDLHSLPTLDMLLVIKQRLGYRISLDNLGRATFDLPKSADGLQALEWWKQGDIASIRRYCQDDVALTKQLYEYGHEHGFLLFSNKAGQKVRVPVTW